jgi:hypothetical protein
MYITPTSAEPICEASRMRCASPPDRVSAERSSVQPDVVQETQARRDLAYDLFSDLGEAPGQMQLVEEGLGTGHAHLRDLRQAQTVDEHMPRSRIQTRAMALGAGLFGQIACELLAHRSRVGLAVATFEVGYYALEDAFLGAQSPIGGRGRQPDLLVAGAVEYHGTDLGREVLPGRLHIEPVMPRQTVQEAEVPCVAAIPAAHGPAGQAQLRVSYYPLGIEILAHPQAVAGGARAGGVVEREESGLEFAQCVAADRTGKARRERQGLAFRVVHPGDQGETLG